MNTAFDKLLAQLNEYHLEVLKRDVLDNPTQLGDYLVKIRAYANFILPYINQALDTESDLHVKCEEARVKLYEKNIADGMSASGAEKDARERTRLLEAKVSVAHNAVEKLRNDYRRFDSLVITMQSRLREFNTDKLMER